MCVYDIPPTCFKLPSCTKCINFYNSASSRLYKRLFFSTCYFFLIGPTDVNLVEETNDKRKTQVFFTNPMIKIHDSDASSDVMDPPRQSWLHNHGVHESNPSEYISNYPEPDYCWICIRICIEYALYMHWICIECACRSLLLSSIVYLYLDLN